jgi:hypothetical protein
MDSNHPINTVIEFENKFNNFFANRHLSPAGKQRVEQSMHLLSGYLKMNNIVMEKDKAIAGVVVVLVEDAISGVGDIAMAKVEGNEDKEALFAAINDRTDSRSYDAVITVAEAWMATVDSGESITCAPSQHPQRKEAVITSLHMNIDFKPCVVTAMQEISRNGDQVKLLTPQFSFVAGDEIRGRMTGFEKNLCPVT